MKRSFFLTGLVMVSMMTIGVGCKPKTTAQKIEDKAEDAQHEVQQGVERAGENVKDATSR